MSRRRSPSRLHQHQSLYRHSPYSRPSPTPRRTRLNPSPNTMRPLHRGQGKCCVQRTATATVTAAHRHRRRCHRVRAACPPRNPAALPHTSLHDGVSMCRSHRHAAGGVPYAQAKVLIPRSCSIISPLLQPLPPATNPASQQQQQPGASSLVSFDMTEPTSLVSFEQTQPSSTSTVMRRAAPCYLSVMLKL